MKYIEKDLPFFSSSNANNDKKLKELENKAKVLDYMWYNTPFDYIMFDEITDDIYTNSYMFGVIPEYVTSFTSKGLTNIGNQMFSQMPNITKIDMPNVTTIETTPIYDTPLLKTMIVGTLTQTTKTSFRQESVKGRGTLETLIIGANTTADLHLQWSIKYPQLVLHNIIDNLADKTGQTAGIITLGETNIAKISDEYKQKLINKNWEYS